MPSQLKKMRMETFSRLSFLPTITLIWSSVLLHLYLLTLSSRWKKLCLVIFWSFLTKRATLPSSISNWVAARPIMPKRRRGVLHRKGAMLLNGNGIVKLWKQPNSRLVSGNVWHVDESSHYVKLPASTSVPIPKWSMWEGKQPVNRPQKPHPWQSWTSPLQ